MHFVEEVKHYQVVSHKVRVRRFEIWESIQSILRIGAAPGTTKQLPLLPQTLCPRRLHVRDLTGIDL